MDAGKLRHQIQIWYPPAATAPDSFGDLSAAYTAGPLVWADIQPGSGREFWMAQQTRADITHVITVRYNATISARCRATWRDNDGVTHTFEFGPALVADMRQFEMKFTAVEKASR